ncbi:MAG: Ig-like domain-containing protein, partial [Thermodesulfobacteriota bacterium]
MSTINRLKQGVSFLIAAVFCVTGAWTTMAMAEGSYCATVKIEIRQELTLERQAFDAHMRINNGLTNIALTDINVVVSFTDEEGNVVEASNDPSNTTASFFIRADSGNIDAYNSSDDCWPVDDVAPASSSDLHWLIIPAPGSADENPEGKLYYVGARLTYTMGGEEHVTEVSPDYIFVKPLPLLMLDYFLSQNVYGDDAFTPATEPSVPFTLGVRVKNTGHNTAYDLEIDSAQPKIIENEHNLLIGFSIIGSEVNGVTTENSLLVSFGDVAPNEAAVGRWQMICSLSGIFTEFSATVTHADELGGQLTSIIDGNPQTHFLVRDVLVDLPGRDANCDFLAKDGDTLRVYESEAVSSIWDTVVIDYSDVATFSGSGNNYTFSFSPGASEFVYARATDPFSGQKTITEVIRGDGKRIKAANAWLSKERKDPPSAGWDYYINVFDVASTGGYTVVFGTASANQPPVIDLVMAQNGVEGQLLSFDIQATDPEGLMPHLSISNLPDGASFTDNGDGSGTFTWMPAPGQAGSYMLSFRASDDELITMQIVPVTISAGNDSDGDGMDDNWELEHFGNLDRDGSGD